MLAIGKPAPNFTLPATGNKTISLNKLRGQNVVLYFYPKDCTSGCTLQGQDFRDHQKEFAQHDAIILGVSRDTIKLHEKFKKDYDFSFDLLSDKEEEACTLYDVIKDKTMYGKPVRGIERSTFLIDKEGILRREWRKVKVDGHVVEVLNALKSL